MVFLDFFKWYYWEAPANVFTIWHNFFGFFFDFFGIRYHLITLFRPWHGMVLVYEGHSRIQNFFYNLTSRIIGSVLGAIVRSMTIIAGIGTMLICFVFLPIGEILWFFLPFLIFFSFMFGIRLMV